MVGRKFFMALVKEFQELCQILSCQNRQTSPTHVGLDKSQAHQQTPNTNTHSLTPIQEEEEDVLYDEMGNKPVKLLDCDTSAYQDHVLRILREEKAPLKDSNFSPYAPLPAIGKNNYETLKSERTIVRQQTYRVLNPVYIKGPMDICKFPPIKSNVMIEEGVLKRNNHQVKNQLPRKNSLEKMTMIVEEPKLNHIKSQKKPKQALRLNGHIPTDTEIFKQNDVNKENTTAFWIDF